MKIPKAIEIQEQYLKQRPTHISTDLDDAIKLGIEALKRLLHDREYSVCLPHDPLPGETPETNPRRSLHHIKAVQESPLGREPKA